MSFQVTQSVLNNINQKNNGWGTKVLTQTIIITITIIILGIILMTKMSRVPHLSYSFFFIVKVDFWYVWFPTFPRMLFNNPQRNNINVLFQSRVGVWLSNKACHLPVHDLLAAGVIAAVSLSCGWIAFWSIFRCCGWEIGISASTVNSSVECRWMKWMILKLLRCLHLVC